MNDNATPLVSVVIPTYNHARYLGRALQSVLDQTYTNWEAIVIDNHSTDNTDEVMSTFVNPRITYLKIQNSGIIAKSRNAGIREAKGELIAFLDSDDWWTEDKLEVCISYFDKETEFVYHDLKIVADEPRLFRSKKIKSWQVKSPVLIDLIERGNAIATSSSVVKAILLNQINGMNESHDMVAAEDFNTWLRIAQLTDGFKYVSKQLGCYQLHKQGISRKDMSVPVEKATAEFMHFLRLEQKHLFEANLRYTRGRFKYLSNDNINAKENLLFAMRHGKLSLKPKLTWMLFIIAISYL